MEGVEALGWRRIVRKPDHPIEGDVGIPRQKCGKVRHGHDIGSVDIVLEGSAVGDLQSGSGGLGVPLGSNIKH